MTNMTEYDPREKYNFISEQLARYGGSALYLMSLFGILMSMLTFSQRVYNCRACSLYLLVASACDFFHLHLGLLPNILQFGFHYHSIVASVSYCKIKTYLVYVLTAISATLTTLAMINRYLLSSTKSSHWRYSSRLNGVRSIATTFVVWVLMSIPILFCSRLVSYPSESVQTICSHSYRYTICVLVQLVYVCLLNGFLPPLIMMIVGFRTHENGRRLRQRSQSKSTPIRRINEQLTLMFILQSVKSTVTSLPYSVFNSYRILTIDQAKSPINQARENLANEIVQVLFWSNYTSFFVYIYSSDVFRHEWMKAVRKIMRCRWRRRQTYYGYDIR